MPTNSDLLPLAPSWFCLRSQPKREHIAAAHLRALDGVEVFSPRVRYRKATLRGPVTFVEALFPSYLFARFDLRIALDEVKHTPSISTVVHFGGVIPVVPDSIINELKSTLVENDIEERYCKIIPGNEVTIATGPFLGMRAKVLRVLTPYQRVEVLLEMLGRVTPVAVDMSILVLEE